MTACRSIPRRPDQARDRADRAGVTVEHQIIHGGHHARALIQHAHQHGFE
jgi:nucleotide-binding universal stress UspA family protein